MRESRGFAGVPALKFAKGTSKGEPRSGCFLNADSSPSKLWKRPSFAAPPGLPEPHGVCPQLKGELQSAYLSLTAVAPTLESPAADDRAKATGGKEPGIKMEPPTLMIKAGRQDEQWVQCDDCGQWRHVELPPGTSLKVPSLPFCLVLRE